MICILPVVLHSATSLWSKLKVKKNNCTFSLQRYIMTSARKYSSSFRAGSKVVECTSLQNYKLNKTFKIFFIIILRNLHDQQSWFRWEKLNSWHSCVFVCPLACQCLIHLCLAWTLSTRLDMRALRALQCTAPFKRQPSASPDCHKACTGSLPRATMEADPS